MSKWSSHNKFSHNALSKKKCWPESMVTLSRQCCRLPSYVKMSVRETQKAQYSLVLNKSQHKKSTRMVIKLYLREGIIFYMADALKMSLRQFQFTIQTARFQILCARYFENWVDIFAKSTFCKSIVTTSHHSTQPYWGSLQNITLNFES